MKKRIALATVLLLSTQLQARTTLYGEVAATVQSKFNDDGTVMIIDGAGSEFGFVGEHALTPEEQIAFDMKLGFDLLSPGLVTLVEGNVNVLGSFGEVGVYNGASPATQSTELLDLMNNDPDSNGFALGASHRLNATTTYAPIGVSNSVGIRYASPELEPGITFTGAVIASEAVDRATGVSLAARYSTSAVDVTFGFELNVEQANSQLFRVAGEVPIGNASVGGMLQLASNADVDASIRSTIAFVKFPLNWANFATNNQLIVSLTARTDAAEDTATDGYFSLVQEIPWSAKVSSFAFVDSLWADNLNDVTTWLGGGVRIKF